MPNTEPAYEAMRHRGIDEAELKLAVERGELCGFCFCDLDRCECGELENE